jgi:uncharacterized membrane protein
MGRCWFAGLLHVGSTATVMVVWVICSLVLRAIVSCCCTVTEIARMLMVAVLCLGSMVADIFCAAVGCSSTVRTPAAEDFYQPEAAE